MFIVVGLLFVIMFVVIFFCNFVQLVWDISIFGECINWFVLYQVMVIFGVIIDLMVLVVLIFIVVRFYVFFKYKIVLIVVFSVGGM